MGNAFGKPSNLIVLCFQVASVLSTIFRLVVGILMDRMKIGTGIFSKASKNVMALVLIIQTMLFFALPGISSGHHFGAFLIASTGIMVMFAAGAVCACGLARDMFGEENSTLVFGVGATIALSFGEFVAGSLITTLRGWRYGLKDIREFNMFYMVAGVVNAVGVIVFVALGEVGEWKNKRDLHDGETWKIKEDRKGNFGYGSISVNNTLP